MFSSTGLPVLCRLFSPTFLWMIGVGKDFIRLFFISLFGVFFHSSWPSFKFLWSPETFHASSLEMNLSFVLLKAFVFSGLFCIYVGDFSGLLLLDSLFKGVLEFAGLIQLTWWILNCTFLRVGVWCAHHDGCFYPVSIALGVLRVAIELVLG